MKFNIPLIPQYLSQTVLNHSDRIMIQYLISNEAAEIYSLAYGISTIMITLNTAVNNTLNPWIFQSIKQNSIKRIGKVSYVLLIIIALCNLLLIALAPAEYYNAVSVIPPVAMAVYFRVAYCLFADFEFYYEKTIWMMIVSLIGAIINVILNIILNIIFLPLCGYIAAAYTTLLCYFIYSFLHYVFMRIICKKYTKNQQPYDLKIIVCISMTFMVIGFVFMFFYDNNNRIIRCLFVWLCAIWFFIRKNYIINIFNDIRTVNRIKEK